MAINIKETRYKRFVVARTLEDACIPSFYKEASPGFNTLEKANLRLTPDTQVFEFECTKHQVTSNK